MTRENAKNIAEAISFKIEERQRLSLPGVNELIDQIFNDFKAELKAKDEEIEMLKEHITHLQNVYMKLDGKYLKLKTELEELKDDK